MTSRLFEPLNVGPVLLKNRISHVAAIGNYGRDGLPTDDLVAYYARRAAGGVGLIVTEGASVHPTSQPNPAVMHLYDPATRPGLVKLASAVHQHGVPIFLQLWHVGRQQLWGPVGSPWGVSPHRDALSGAVPHVMTIGEIQEIERAFIDGALLAQATGFDGIEIHGAHGYLVTQFLSPWSNTREDAYGGDFDGRMRFLRNITRGIRDACGDTFAIGLKLSGSEFVDGGLTAGDTRAIIASLEADRLVDLVAINQGNFSISLEYHVPDMHFSPAPFADVIAQCRPNGSRLPIMAIGRIMDRALCEELIGNGTADMIGMARALISEPDLPKLWQLGDDEHVRGCISCNVCWGMIVGGKRMLCIHNPEVGNERAAQPARAAAHARDVHVIGGGPAGMEAAWVAASRGHRVHLWEANGELGGQVRWLAAFPGLAEYGDILTYQRKRLAEFGVDIHCGRSVDASDLSLAKGAAVVLATGSRPQASPRGLTRFTPLVPDDPRWASLVAGTGRAVVFDEDWTYAAYGPVDRLIELGYDVTLASSRTELGMGLDYLSRIGLHRRLRSNHVRVLTGVEPSVGSNGSVRVRDVFTGEHSDLGEAALVVWAGPRVSAETPQFDPGAGIEVIGPIGDARSPRAILSAIHEGHAAGRAL